MFLHVPIDGAAVQGELQPKSVGSGLLDTSTTLDGQLVEHGHVECEPVGGSDCLNLFERYYPTRQLGFTISSRKKNHV